MRSPVSTTFEGGASASGGGLASFSGIFPPSSISRLGAHKLFSARERIPLINQTTDSKNDLLMNKLGRARLFSCLRCGHLIFRRNGTRPKNCGRCKASTWDREDLPPLNSKHAIVSAEYSEEQLDGRIEEEQFQARTSFPPRARGRPGNPEIARIMAERGCSRQRAHQILHGKK